MSRRKSCCRSLQWELKEINLTGEVVKADVVQFFLQPMMFWNQQRELLLIVLDFKKEKSDLECLKALLSSAASVAEGCNGNLMSHIQSAK